MRDGVGGSEYGGGFEEGLKREEKGISTFIMGARSVNNSGNTNRRDRRRVVVTGMGWVTPLGYSIEDVWSKLLAGESGIGPITGFDASTFPTQFAAQVKDDFDFREFVRDAEAHKHARANSRFALGAASQAWKQAGLCEVNGGLDRRKVGLYLGAGESPPNFDTYAKTNLIGWKHGDGRSINAREWVRAAKELIEPWGEIEQEPNMPAMHLSWEFGLAGPTFNTLTACAASTQAIGEAVEIIRRGDADVMVAGGTHTMIHPLGVTGFNRLTALSTHNDDPATASRPFDLSRDGFVMGEGSGVVILELLEHASAREAEVLAEITGFGSSADAFRITDMHPEGRGAMAAMQKAISDAGLDPSGRGEDGRPLIHYISAHGTGTKENDSTETMAIKGLFGEETAREIPISSIKSMMGHLIAAAGAVELIVCVLAIRDGIIPPTTNLHQPDPECDLDYVPNEPRRIRVDTALSNSFGFGGQNDTLLVQRYGELFRGK